MFVNKPISNYDIQSWIAYFSVKTFRGVISRDEIPSISNKGYYICNLNDSTQTGSHWVGIHIKVNIVEYFDSFGLNAPEELVELTNRLRLNYLYNSTQYQALTSVLCGYYCLYFVNESYRGSSYYHLLKPFSHSDTSLNEKFIRGYFKRLL